MSNSIKQEVINEIKTVFANENLKYTYDDEEEFFWLGFDIDCMVDTAKLIIFVEDDFYLAYATANLTVTGNWSEIYEYIARANSNLINGNFEVDSKTGAVKYKLCVDFCDKVPAQRTIKRTARYAILTLEKYLDGFLKVMSGALSARDAINQIESKEEDEETE